ncbi:MAG: phage terminase large subunit [Hydrogenoanaerobacterium sp.]
MNKVKIQKINKLFNLISPIETEFKEEEFKTRQNLKQLILKHLDTKEFTSFAEQRTRLSQMLKAGAPLTGADGIRKQLGAFDLAFFGRAYLPHYFSKPSPPFHKDLDNIWQNGVLKSFNPLQEPKLVDTQNGCHSATAAPRGHAKSTNLTFKDTLHAVVYMYKHYALLISDTYPQAAGFLEAIKDELEDNTALIEDFGSLKGEVWREDVIITTTRIKLQAKGAGQKVRGLKHKNWRPDLIVLDDLENDENVRTPEQREKLKNWYFKAVSKCGDFYTDFVYIGTVLHYDSLLVKVMNTIGYTSVKYKAVLSFSSSPLWDEWESIITDLNTKNRELMAAAFFKMHKSEMLAGTEVLWEEKLSYYDLMFMRVSEGEASFNSEEQNEPIDPEDCLFNEDNFDYYNPHDVNFADKDFGFYGFVDPSLGKNKKSDYSAIITIAKSKTSGYMYIADADIERRLPSLIIEAVLSKAVWLKQSFGQKYVKFGCETNQFQYFLKTELAKEAAKHKIYLPIVEVQQSCDKTMRIQTLEPDINNKYIKFNRQHKRLLEQLKFFPMADHDDAPDALEGCRTIACGGNRKRIKIGKRRFGL